MSDGRIESVPGGTLRLLGVLDLHTGPALREQGRGLIRADAGAELVVDCSAIEKSSSVGLSLLLAFMRDARAAQRPVRISGMPADMLEIARVSGLLDILPLDAAPAGSSSR
ncbi:hypothetical protein YO5_04072 [Stutzerimonas stutzeri TS44]|nr:hypothetical protein YO5_04072 [Stutzerimonas stutzeri TS44]